MTALLSERANSLERKLKEDYSKEQSGEAFSARRDAMKNFVRDAASLLAVMGAINELSGMANTKAALANQANELKKRVSLTCTVPCTVSSDIKRKLSLVSDFFTLLYGLVLTFSPYRVK